MLTQIGNTKNLSILLVGNDPHYRSGLQTQLRTILGKGCAIEVCGVKTAISSIEQKHFDLVLLEMELSHNDDAIALMLQLQEREERVNTLAISSTDISDYRIYQAIQVGAMGYIFKSQLAWQLEDAIATVLRGERYLSSKVVTQFIRHFQASHSSPTTPTKTTHLTSREYEVLQLMVQGASNKKIAEKLFVSMATVKFYVSSIFEKLDVPRCTQENSTANKSFNSRVLVVLKAIKWGLVTLDRTKTDDSQFSI